MELYLKIANIDSSDALGICNYSQKCVEDINEIRKNLNPHSSTLLKNEKAELFFTLTEEENEDDTEN